MQFLEFISLILMPTQESEMKKKDGKKKAMQK